MEKQITIMTADSVINKVKNMCDAAMETPHRALNIIGTPLQMLGHYYSEVLERPLNMRQIKALTVVQAAFFVTILPADYPFILRAAACAWFITSLIKCRQVM